MEMSMKQLSHIFGLGLLLVSFATYSDASDTSSEAVSLDEITQRIIARIAEVRPDLPITSVTASPLAGFYDAALPGGQILHFSADAKYFFTGDLYEVQDVGLVNVTEKSRTDARKQMLAQLDESEMLVFSPPKGLVKATVTVFTDIDCSYCRKLHKEIPDLNRLGIAVRYLAYPRAGIDSESYDKYVSAWCADNPKIALTRAKNGQAIEDRTCENPVAAQFQLGGEFGVNSTPSIIHEDGTLMPGYLPADKLAETLGILDPAS
jgi:thiol:disulfide interchange protein DsbC|tara:strand:- start:4454 stop:5242 length:789 start_codon:yes stop_codon:yes gene_type:complete